MSRKWAWITGGTAALALIVLVAVTLGGGVRYQGKSAQAWLRDLLAKNTNEREQARAALQQMGPRLIPLLRNRLLSRDSFFKRALMHLDWRVAAVDLDWTTDRQWRSASLLAVQELGTNALPVLPQILEAFYDRQLYAGSDLFEPALVALGMEGIPPVATSLQGDEGRNYPMRHVVLRAWLRLLNQREPAEDTATLLYQTALAGVNGPINFYEAESAARLLGKLGARARPAGPALLKLLDHPNVRVKVAATLALGDVQFDPESLVPALRAHLTDSNGSLKIALLDVLSAQGAAAVPAVPDMARLIFDDSVSVQMRAVKALTSLGALAAAAAPELEKALDHPNLSVRALAARSLRETHPQPQQAVHALTKALRHEDQYVRQTVVLSLGKFGAEAAPAVPRLIEMLRDSRESVQTSVVETLGLIGTEAEPAVPHLLRAWDNNQSALGPYVKVALQRINGTEIRLP